MISSRTALALLTAAAFCLTGATAGAKPKPRPATPQPSPCTAPASGFHTCLSVSYVVGADGSVQDARVLATAVERTNGCARPVPTRRLRVSVAGRRVAASRRPGRCRRGVTMWSATYAPGDTAAWDLAKGDTVRADWAGVKRPSKVRLG